MAAPQQESAWLPFFNFFRHGIVEIAQVLTSGNTENSFIDYWSFVDQMLPHFPFPQYGYIIMDRDAWKGSLIPSIWLNGAATPHGEQSEALPPPEQTLISLFYVLLFVFFRFCISLCWFFILELREQLRLLRMRV